MKADLIDKVSVIESVVAVKYALGIICVGFALQSLHRS